MSQIRNIISTTFTSSAGNAVAVMNQVSGGASHLGRNLMQTQRYGGMLDNQLRALSTTLRYAFAGSVVFGARNLLGTLKETQGQMALWGAIGDLVDSSGRKIENTDARLQRMYLNSRRGAMEALVPVNDMNDAITNLLSTVQDIPEDDVTKITTALAQGARMAQIQTDELTKSIAGMNQAFHGQGGQTLQNFQSGVRGFFTLTKEAPGGPSAGPQFVQQIAPLAGISRFANMSPSQMFGLYLTTLRTGATPATAGRGLQYLLQSLAVPASKQSERALRRAGITPQAVQDNGGVWAVRQLIEHARSLGISGGNTIKNLTEEQMDIIESSGDPANTLKGLGVSGKGLDFLDKAIGRIHGVRALITLMMNPEQTEKDLRTMATNMGNTVEAQEAFAQAWADFARRQPLQAAATALDVIKRDIADTLEPLFNIAGRGIGELGTQALAHQDIAKALEIAGLTAAAGWGLKRFAGGTPGGRFRGGARGLGAGFMGMQAATAALANSNIPGHSPQNPLYVFVVSEIFKGPTAPVAAGGGSGGSAGRAGGRLGRLGRVATRLGPAGVATTVLSVPNASGFQPSDNEINEALGNLPLLRKLFQLRQAMRSGQAPIRAFSPTELKAFDIAGTPGTRGWSGKQAEDYLRQQMRARNTPFQMPALWGRSNIGQVLRAQGVQGRFVGLNDSDRETRNGRAWIVLDINLRDPKSGEVTRRRVHIPEEQWSGGRVPHSRGDPGRTTRN